LTSGRVMNLADPLGTPPGSTYMNIYSGDASHPYLNLNSLVSPVPVPSTIKPMTAIPVTDRLNNITAFDPYYRTPYIQNITLALTRQVTPNLQVDFKYVGTLSRKLMGTMNINQPNFLTNGLLQAFNAARSGGESTLLDNLLVGVRGTQSGASYLRTVPSYTFDLGIYTSTQANSPMATTQLSPAS
jgi:hypothetical protein